MKQDDVDRIIDWINIYVKDSDIDDIYDALILCDLQGHQISGFIKQLWEGIDNYDEFVEKVGGIEELDKSINTILKRTSGERFSKKERKEFNRVKEAVREKVVTKAGESNVTRPKHVTPKEWNEKYVKVGGQRIGKTKLPSRNLNLSDYNETIIRDGIKAGDKITKISRELSRQDFIARDVKFTEKKVDSHSRQFRDLIKVYGKEHRVKI